MNVVLYTQQMEPITVIDLPMWAIDGLKTGEPICIQVMEPLRLEDSHPDNAATIKVRRVFIAGDVLRRRGASALMLFTDDEESALLLKAAFLPGQISGVKDRAEREFARGVLAAIEGMAR